METQTALSNNVNAIIELLENSILEEISYIETENENFREIKCNDLIKVKETIPCFFDGVYDNVLNYYLDKISKLNIKEYFELTNNSYYSRNSDKIPLKYHKAHRLIDNLMDSCNPCKKYDNVFEDAEYIAYNLMQKKVHVNNHKIKGFINVEHIKDYSISAFISKNEIEFELWYALIYVAVHYYVLKTLNDN